MMRRAALLGNEQAIQYLQERGLNITMDNFVVDPIDASARQTIQKDITIPSRKDATGHMDTF